MYWKKLIIWLLSYTIPTEYSTVQYAVRCTMYAVRCTLYAVFTIQAIWTETIIGDIGVAEKMYEFVYTSIWKADGITTMWSMVWS